MENRIKKLRKDKKMTLKQLSAKTGISVSSLSAYEKDKDEKGYRFPKIDKLESIASSFNVSVPYLQGMTDDQKRGVGSNNSVSSVISTIHSILIYLGRHASTGYIPEKIKNGLIFSRVDDIKLQDTLIHLLNIVNDDGDNYLIEYDKLVKMFSKKLVNEAEKKGIIDKEATKEDVSNIINSYYLAVNDYLLNLKTADDVIDDTIHNLSYLVEQLNIELFNKDTISRHYIRDKDGYITKMVNEPLDEKLPKKIDRETYLKINNTLNNAMNDLLALRKDKPTSPTFFV